MRVYTIGDNKEQCFFGNSTAKKLWTTKGAAKNAVMLNHGASKDNWRKKYTIEEVKSSRLASDKLEHRYLAFQNQTRFECREYSLLNTPFLYV